MKVAIAGGGLAGLSAAWVLAGEGFEVHVYESRQMPGGRAASYSMPRSDGGKECLDNSQHILLRCCSNLLDLYRRIGVDHLIDFYTGYTFLEPGGRTSVLEPGSLPAPLHMMGGFLRLKFLSLRDKLAIVRGMSAVQREYARGPLLDTETMESWLKKHGQTDTAIRCFWEPVLVSAVNANLDEISAWQGVRLVHLGFLASATNYEMGIPKVSLGDLHAAERWTQQPNLHLHLGASVTGFEQQHNQLISMNLEMERIQADVYLSALPFARLGALFPNLRTGMMGVTQSPIAGIHLRFDRKVTHLPYAALLGRTMQWFFAKEDGRMLSLVVSAAHALETRKKEEIVALAVREMSEFLPQVSEAKLLDSWVIRETHATFVASPGFEAKRPGPRTALSNLFLAGEWTNTGWPSTMEGAVISGYRAAEAICEQNGRRRRFVV